MMVPLLLWLSAVTVVVIVALVVTGMYELLRGHDMLPALYYRESALNSRIINRCALRQRTYRPARWLQSCHVQTVMAALMPRGDGSQELTFKREYLQMRDRGVVALDWVTSQQLRVRRKATVLIVLPPVTGDAFTVASLCCLATRRGFRVVVFNRRGHGGSVLTTPKLLNTSDPSDLRQVIKYLRLRYPKSRLGAVAYGTGCSLLISYLGEFGSSALLYAGTCVSPCYEPAERYSGPLRSFYDVTYLLRQKAVLLRHAAALASMLDVRRAVLTCWTFRSFEENVFFAMYDHTYNSSRSVSASGPSSSSPPPFPNTAANDNVEQSSKPKIKFGPSHSTMGSTKEAPGRSSSLSRVSSSSSTARTAELERICSDGHSKRRSLSFSRSSSSTVRSSGVDQDRSGNNSESYVSSSNKPSSSLSRSSCSTVAQRDRRGSNELSAASPLSHSAESCSIMPALQLNNSGETTCPQRVRANTSPLPPKDCDRTLSMDLFRTPNSDAGTKAKPLPAIAGVSLADSSEKGVTSNSDDAHKTATPKPCDTHKTVTSKAGDTQKTVQSKADDAPNTVTSKPRDTHTSVMSEVAGPCDTHKMVTSEVSGSCFAHKTVMSAVSVSDDTHSSLLNSCIAEPNGHLCISDVGGRDSGTKTVTSTSNSTLQSSTQPSEVTSHSIAHSSQSVHQCAKEHSMALEPTASNSTSLQQAITSKSSSLQQPMTSDPVITPSQQPVLSSSTSSPLTVSFSTSQESLTSPCTSDQNNASNSASEVRWMMSPLSVSSDEDSRCLIRPRLTSQSARTTSPKRNLHFAARVTSSLSSLSSSLMSSSSPAAVATTATRTLQSSCLNISTNPTSGSTVSSKNPINSNSITTVLSVVVSETNSPNKSNPNACNNTVCSSNDIDLGINDITITTFSTTTTATTATTAFTTAAIADSNDGAVGRNKTTAATATTPAVDETAFSTDCSSGDIQDSGLTIVNIVCGGVASSTAGNVLSVGSGKASNSDSNRIIDTNDSCGDSENTTNDTATSNITSNPNNTTASDINVNIASTPTNINTITITNRTSTIITPNSNSTTNATTNILTPANPTINLTANTISPGGQLSRSGSSSQHSHLSSTMDEYWERHNPMRDVDDIAVPVLCINSLDDPIHVSDNIPYDLFRCYPNFLLVTTPRGGHCAFLEGLPPKSWADSLCLDYLDAVWECTTRGYSGHSQSTAPPRRNTRSTI